MDRPGGTGGANPVPLAVNTLSFARTLRGGGPESLFTLLSERGVTGIELFDAHANGDLKVLQARANEHHLEVFSLATHVCWLTITSRWRHVEGLARSWFAKAAAAGIPIVRTFVDDLTLPSIARVLRTGGSRRRALATVVERLRAATTLARDHGVVIGIENHWGHSSDPAFLAMLDKQLASMEGVGWVFDTGNWYRGTKVDAQLERMLPRVLYVQAKAKRFDKGKVAGTDYNEIAATLARHGFAGYWSVEYEGGGDEANGVDLTLTAMQDALARAAPAR